MIALAGGLTIALVSVVGVLVWLVTGRVAAADAAADARVALAKQDAELGRAKFENDQLARQFKASDARALAMEEIIRDDVEAAPDPALARSDVRSRLLRLAQRWSSADADRNGAVPARPDVAAVSPDPTPQAPAATPMPAEPGSVR